MRGCVHIRQLFFVVCLAGNILSARPTLDSLIDACHRIASNNSSNQLKKGPAEFGRPTRRASDTICLTVSSRRRTSPQGEPRFSGWSMIPKPRYAN